MTASNPIQAMIKTIKANPAIADNPQAQAYLDVLESGDSKRGEELANNILKTYGASKEETLKKAMAFFNIS